MKDLQLRTEQEKTATPKNYLECLQEIGRKGLQADLGSDRSKTGPSFKSKKEKEVEDMNEYGGSGLRRMMRAVEAIKINDYTWPIKL